MSFKSGSVMVRYGTPVPISTGRNHPGYKIGDASWAIRNTAHKAAGSDHLKCLDWNSQIIWMVIKGILTPVAVGAHWFTLGPNGWTHYMGKDGKIHALTEAQKHWTLQHWCDEHGKDKAAWYMLRRRNPDGAWEKPLTHFDAMKYSKSLGVVLNPELKDNDFRKPAVADRFVGNCISLDYPCWTMALFSMPYCKEKCKAIRGADPKAGFSPIFGDQQSRAKGTNILIHDKWPVAPNRVWGPNHGERDWIEQWHAWKAKEAK
jgi:hypothetical protein